MKKWPAPQRALEIISQQVFECLLTVRALLELSCDSGKQKNREGSDSSPCPPPTCGVVFRSAFTESVRKGCPLSLVVEEASPVETGLLSEIMTQNGCLLQVKNDIRVDPISVSP
ncbi:Fibrillin-2 [Manis pentadactyla]|nr:Fibrillin-2 [Manis pentadactyla]